MEKFLYTETNIIFMLMPRYDATEWGEITILVNSQEFTNKNSRGYNRAMNLLIDLLSTRIDRYPYLNHLRNGLVHDPVNVQPNEVRDFVTAEADNLIHQRPLSANIGGYTCYQHCQGIGSAQDANLKRSNHYLNILGGNAQAALDETTLSYYKDLKNYFSIIGTAGSAVPLVTGAATHTRPQRAAAEHIITCIYEICEQRRCIQPPAPIINTLSSHLKPFRDRAAHLGPALSQQEINECIGVIGPARIYVDSMVERGIPPVMAPPAVVAVQPLPTPQSVPNLSLQPPNPSGVASPSSPLPLAVNPSMPLVAATLPPPQLLPNAQPQATAEAKQIGANLVSLKEKPPPTKQKIRLGFNALTDPPSKRGGRGGQGGGKTH